MKQAITTIESVRLACLKRSIRSEPVNISFLISKDRFGGIEVRHLTIKVFYKGANITNRLFVTDWNTVVTACNHYVDKNISQIAKEIENTGR